MDRIRNMRISLLRYAAQTQIKEMCPDISDKENPAGFARETIKGCSLLKKPCRVLVVCFAGVDVFMVLLTRAIIQRGPSFWLHRLHVFAEAALFKSRLAQIFGNLIMRNQWIRVWDAVMAQNVLCRWLCSSLVTVTGILHPPIIA